MRKPIRVIVTGIGAIIGQGVVASLRKMDRAVQILGVDKNHKCPFRHGVDCFLPKPLCDEASSEYLDFWFDLVKSHQIDLIIPAIENDTWFFNEHRDKFQGIGVLVALNSKFLLDVTANKWGFHKELEQLGIECIPSCRPDNWLDAINLLGNPPFIMKPLVGSGSQGVKVIEDEVDYNFYTTKCKFQWFLQKYVGSDEQEYTIGIFGFGDGTYIGPIRFLRKLNPAGSTQYAEVVGEIPEMDALIETLCLHFKPVGPTNFQFRMSDRSVYLLEINPRFSSSNSLRTAFGFNESEFTIKYFCDGVRPDTPKIRCGVGFRYFEDLVEYARDSI